MLPPLVPPHVCETFFKSFRLLSLLCKGEKISCKNFSLRKFLDIQVESFLVMVD